MGKTYQTTVINAPVDQVWDKIKNFHDFSWASGIIDKCEALGDKSGDQIGARRILNGAFYETLVEFSELDKSFKYSIDDGPPPVSKSDVKDYIGAVRLIPVTDSNTCFIEWSSSWESPTEDACDFCHNIYVALLDELKKAF
ncbi:MAG: SRPBCC family protein [Nitrospinota bacterium]|nr:SRPBCC family protein [Nitrospinota bacterium]